MKESTTEGQDNSLLCACEFAFCSATAHPKTRFLFLKPLPLLLLLVCAYGVAWVRAALVRDLVCPTCSSFSCWVALPCSACASVSPLHPGLPSQFILTLAFLLNSVSPWPSSNSSLPCHAAEPLLCPHNQIVRQQQSVFGLPIGPLWAASSASALSPFPFCRLGQLPCCLPRLAFRNHPLGATGTGLGLLLLLLQMLRLPGAVGQAGVSHCS